MKTVKTIVSIILATASITSVATSCQREKEFSPRTGQSIVFSTWTPGSVSTSKAEYTGNQKTDGSKKYEGINWEAGDIISVASPQTAEKCEEYRVETGKVNESAAVPVNRGLHWGSDPHTFYGMYPGLSKVTGSNLTEEGVLTGVISATQTPKYDETESKYIILEKSSGSYTVPADLKNGYMYSKATGVEPYSEEVPMTFIPFTTAIQFTITNDYEHDGSLNIRSISVISESGKNLSGTFTAELAGLDGGYPTCTTATTGGKDRVTMDFTSTTEAGYIALAKGKTLEFTLFFNPGAGDLDDLYFRVNKGTTADEGWIQTKLAYKDMTGIAFPCHKKSYVTGILVPEGAIWTVRFDPSVNAWGDGGSSDENPTPELGYTPVVSPWTTGGRTDQDLVKYNYSLGLEGTLEFGHAGKPDSTVITISSLKELNHDETPVVWHLEYWDEDEGTGAWKPARAKQKIKGFVSFNPTLGIGDEEIEMVGISELKMRVEAATAGETFRTSHNDTLQHATPKGTEKPYDLSMYDIYGNARPAGKPVTANCYVINAPGRYALPLVYGNAIDNYAAPAGGVNVPAYDPGAEADPTPTFRTRFTNANGRGILTPYIEEDPSDIINPAATEAGWTAVVLMNEKSIGVTASILDEASAKTSGLSACECGYLVFNVSAENLTQGNFVLAVKHNGQVMWSWHIWVTDNDLSGIPAASNSPLTMLPYNLGWVDSDVTTKYNHYEGNSVKMKAVQSGSGVELEFTVVRREETDEVKGAGSSPWWQWGRKDPFLSTPGKEAVSGDIAYSIKNPTKFIYGVDDKYQWYTESVIVEGGSEEPATYLNLWSATNKVYGTSSTGYNSKPIKTVYDPCPPGFQVPQADAFKTLPAGVVLPSEGYISYKTGKFVNDGGYYWNAVPSGAKKSYHTGSTAGINQTAYRSNGYSVRPVKQ